MGGGGESAEAAFRAMKSISSVTIVPDEEIRVFSSLTPLLRLQQYTILAAFEFACLDILGQMGRFLSRKSRGGRLRDRVPFASYLFFRYPDPQTAPTKSELSTNSSVHAKELKERYGFTSHKLKGEVFPPDTSWSVTVLLPPNSRTIGFGRSNQSLGELETAIAFGQQIEDIRNDYLEDPVFGMAGMRRVREKVLMPLGNDMVVVSSEQLAANALDTAVDAIC